MPQHSQHTLKSNTTQLAIAYMVSPDGSATTVQHGSTSKHSIPASMSASDATLIAAPIAPGKYIQHINTMQTSVNASPVTELRRCGGGRGGWYAANCAYHSQVPKQTQLTEQWLRRSVHENRASYSFPNGFIRWMLQASIRTKHPEYKHALTPV